MNHDHQIQEEQSLKTIILDGFDKHPVLKNCTLYVDVYKNQVTLHGLVDHLSLKWLAEDYVADLLGVLSISNRIEVRKESVNDESSYYSE